MGVSLRVGFTWIHPSETDPQTPSRLGPLAQEGKPDTTSRVLGSLWSAAEDIFLFYHQARVAE